MLFTASTAVSTHYHSFSLGYAHTGLRVYRMYTGQHELRINRPSRSLRATRGRPVIGSQPHPARSVSARSGAPAGLLGVLRYYSCRTPTESSPRPLPIPLITLKIVSFRARARTLLTRARDYRPRADIIKRIAPRLYCARTAAASEPV